MAGSDNCRLCLNLPDQLPEDLDVEWYVKEAERILDDIGVEPYMVATALKGVISQRLVRRICPHCRESYTPTAEEFESIGLDPVAEAAKGTQFYRGAGCPECFGSGYRGRTVVAEVLTIDHAMSEAIHERKPREELLSAVRASGFEPIIKNCRELVLNGTTTVNEVLRSVLTTE